MKVDYSKFKKTHEDDHSATLRHPDGHEFRIAKKTLSKKMRDQLASLPAHFAEGGEVLPPELEAEINKARKSQKGPAAPGEFYEVGDGYYRPDQDFKPSGDASRAPASFLGDIGSSVGKTIRQGVGDAAQAFSDVAKPVMDAGSGFLKGLAGVENAEAQQAIQGQPQGSLPQPAQAPAQAPLSNYNLQPARVPSTSGAMAGGMESYDKMLTQGLGMQTRGLQGAAKAEAQIGDEIAKNAQDNAAQMQLLMQKHQEQSQAIQQEIGNVLKDYKDGRINPNHYMESKSSGARVMSAIGLILGGIGAGLTGKDNPALTYLNAQIDRDIDAQKANLGKKENILSAYYKQMGNLKDATDMARLVQASLYANKLEEAKAKSMDPMAKARADQAIGQLYMQYAPIYRDLSMRKAVMGGGQSGEINPALQIRFLVPEGQQAKAYEELQTQQRVVKARENLLSSFDKLNQLNTVGNRVRHLGFESAEVAALRDPLLAQLSKETAGRFTEADAEFLKSVFPAPGDSDKTVQTKRRQMEHLINEKMSFPMLEAYGIKTPTHRPAPNTNAPAGYKR